MHVWSDDVMLVSRVIKFVKMATAKSAARRGVVYKLSFYWLK